MKSPALDPLAAQDIQAQVDKVLRGLGNPEPPLRLDEVRELLRLDLRFYSTTNTGALDEFISKVKVGAKQLAMRPALILDVVRKAGLKALWLPDRKRILIDETIPDSKKRHAEAHEVIHSITPHHALFMLGDDGETLRHSCHERLEAEANFGSGQLLFLRGRFAAEAADSPRTLKTVLALSETFGNTITMTLWRIVEEADDQQPAFGIVSGHPRRPGATFNPSAPCKYFIESPEFRRRFGHITEVAAFEAVRTYAINKRGGPLGEGEVIFLGLDGLRYRFRMESFFNGHEALTLGVCLGPVLTQVPIA